MVAGKSGTFYGQQMTAGDVYTVAGDGSPFFSGDGGPALNAGMDPVAVAVDGSGNLVLAGSRVRVVATRTGTFYGQAMTAGDIYTVAGDGQEGFSGDGGPAVDASMGPVGVTVDPAGNLVISDIDSYRLRVVAATTGMFYGQSMTAGDIYTIAGGGGAPDGLGDGGPATLAFLKSPTGVTVDSNGNVVFADEFHGRGRVRVVAVSTGTFYGQSMTAGDIYTIAGGGKHGLGDGGPGTKAEVDPYWVAVTPDGDIAVTDTGNGRIRLVSH